MSGRNGVLTMRLAPVLAAILTACGGGGDDGEGEPADASITGTAAVGAALANANVSVIDASRANACTEAAITTSGVGGFTCTLASGRSAPFVVRVTHPSGAHPPLVGVATSAPAAGATMVVNATPLTTAIVGQLAPDGDALAVAADPSRLDAAALADVKARVLRQIGPALAALGAPADYDPFATPLVAATAQQAGNTADRVLETLRFSRVDGVMQVSTVDRPEAAVPLAGPGTAEPAVLPAPSAGVVALSQALRQLAAAFDACFALPLATRVTATDRTIAAARGGPAVTAVAPACERIPTTDAYLHNGYSGGQHFFALLTDAAMDGATFSPPEVMRFIDDPGAADNDRAIVNLRFVDANGVAGNLVTILQRFPGDTVPGGASDWWLHGNQQPVESSVRPYIRRNEQLAPDGGLSGTFANASASRYEAGIDLFVNKDGPGSEGMRAARVKGPGLPPAGVVLTRPDPSICTEQSWLNLRRKDGRADPASATFAADTGNIFRLQRTAGLAGADASSVRPNPNAGNTNAAAFPNWAHPLDYGAPVGAPAYIDFASLKSNAEYTFEVFYDGETAPRHTFTKTMLQPVIPATRGGGLQWIALTPGTLAYLDPAGALAAPQATVNLAWTPNPFAETIRSAAFYTFGAGETVNQGLIGVARGATGAVGNAPGGSGCEGGAAFARLTGDATSGRAIQLRYRMLDGSYKDSMTRFN